MASRSVGFLSPPATLSTHDRLDHMPFVDRQKVRRLLDGFGGLDPGEQVSVDQILMILLSGCVLGEQLGLTG